MLINASQKDRLCDFSNVWGEHGWFVSPWTLPLVVFRNGTQCHCANHPGKCVFSLGRAGYPGIVLPRQRGLSLGKHHDHGSIQWALASPWKFGGVCVNLMPGHAHMCKLFIPADRVICVQPYQFLVSHLDTWIRRTSHHTHNNSSTK